MRPLVLALALACAACTSPTAPATSPPTAKRDGSLEVALTADAGIVTAVLTNRGAVAVALPAQVLTSAQLFLVVTDAKAARVAPLPPPVPNGEKVTLAPGESRTVTLSLDAFPLSAGDYDVAVAPSVAGGNHVALHVP